MIALIDNYDSFTYNLVQYLGELGEDVQVYRNDAITVEGLRALQPECVVISPGPCTPNEAGISVETVRQLGPEIPMLGVCLGHQSIGAAYGGDIVRAGRIMHGKISQIRHMGHPFFGDVESPFIATRYHSLIIQRDTCPAVLEITAETAEGEIMAVAHREHPVYGVQFHPESILTECGKRLLRNFITLGRAWNAEKARNEITGLRTVT